MQPAWHPHPDRAFETLLETGTPQALQTALRQAPAAVDRYAHLRVLDRLRQTLPHQPDLDAAWMQAMLLSNRPRVVHAVTRSWPMHAGPEPGWSLIAAQVAQTMGAKDEARARFRALLQAHPELVDAWQKFFEFEPQVSSADLAQVRRLHQRAADAYVREKAAFALATALQRDAPAEAFELAADAHRLKRRRVGAWRGEETRERLARDRAWTPSPPHEVRDPRPVFVVGLPRSGTTLLTRILGSHSAVVGVGEQALVPNLATRLAQRTLTPAQAATFAPAWYRAALGDLAGSASVLVDKLPANAEHVGLILALLPDALVIWLERDAPDCALSIHLRDFEFGFLYADDPEDLGRYTTMLRDQREHWCARAPARVFALRYEDLVRDPAQTLGPVMAAAGLEWQPTMLEFWRRDEQIATYSEAQVRRPLHAEAIGGWTRFLPQAEAFLRAAGALAG